VNHPNDTPDDDFDPVACEMEMARRRLITIDPNDQEEGFDRFVHVDEVAAVAAERDAYRAALLRLAAIVVTPGAEDTIDQMAPEDADGLADVVLEWLAAAKDGETSFRAALIPIVPDEHENDNRRLLVRLQRMATEHAEQRALLHRVAVALGQPDQDLAGLPDSVDALRRQRDLFRDAARDAHAIGIKP